MAKQHKVKNKTTLEYEKELKRIKSFINKIEKRGYFDINITIPKRPKRITESSAKRLQKITPQEIYKSAQFVDTETGEIISGTKGHQLELQKRNKKSAETRKANRKAEQEFWGGDTKPKQDYVPNGGQIIFNNVFDDFITRLSQPTPEYTQFSKKRLSTN